MAAPSFLIVTTMKNEGAFVLEWIAFNRAIGFTDFLIFTNDCADGTDRIAMRLEELGLAAHVANRLKPGQSPQRAALRKARWHPRAQAADWLICADVDEFLNIRTGTGRLADLMEAVGPVDAVSVCWKLFGNAGRTSFERGFVTEQFTRAAPERRFPGYRARGVKTLYRTGGGFRAPGIHRPRLAEGAPPPVWVDGGGRPVSARFAEGGWSAKGDFSHDFARLHHYAVRSADSFLVKRDRGRTNHVNADQGLDYWRAMNANHEDDRSLLPRLEAARAEYARLIADPELARLHEAACAWHEAKIAELRARAGWEAFRDRIAAETGGMDAAEAADAGA